jgi:hypothetical protein
MTTTKGRHRQRSKGYLGWATADVLNHLYVEQKRSVIDIAVLFRTDEARIKELLEQCNIEYPGNAEAGR